ncbi:MAG: hypothetical protein KBS64_03235 [Treponema sp.]|nr:hypothetical protein [Candidatus Treponema equi]
MKKIMSFIAMAFAAVSLFAADAYVVDSFKGKVQYEAEPGTWKDVENGQKISSATVVKTALNSTLVVADGSNKITIKAMQNGALDKLVGEASKTAKSIKKGSLKNDSVAAKSDKSSKGQATASSRASEAKAELDWDE